MTSAPEVEAGGVGRFEAIFDRAPVSIGFANLDGLPTWTNNVLPRSLGYSPEEFAALSPAVYTHPDDLEAAFSRFSQMVNGEAESYSMDRRFIRKDGGTLWMSVTVSLVRDLGGRPDFIIVVAQDITDRNQLETPQADQQRARLRVERIPAIVYVAEPGADGRWLYVSPQIEAVLGFTAREWMDDPGLWNRQLFAEDQEGALAEEERLLLGPEAEGGVYSDTYRLRHRNGTTVWVRSGVVSGSRGK